MARGGQVLRRRATAPAKSFGKTAQAGPIMRQPVSCVNTALAHVPSEAEVLEAVVSLYNDGLRPYSRIVRKRLIEHAREMQVGLLGKDSENTVSDCDADKLRALCEASLQLRVEAEDWGEWSALLVDREPNFIDIYDPVDNYSQEFWIAAESYFRSLGESNDHALVGGRYASAMALAQRRLPFLEGYSLGQICHITQLAITQRKLLGYFNGAIVPYNRSTSMLKCRCAEQQRPLVDPPVSGSPDGPVQFQVADWSTARLKLREILDSAVLRGADQVPLSNVKRLFRSLYQMELSETALGHSKLTELLQDPGFSDICTVQLQDRGYAVVPAYPIQRTALKYDSVARGTNIHQVTPQREAHEQQRLSASNGTTQRQCDYNLRAPVREKVPPLMLTPSPPHVMCRSFSMPMPIEASDENGNSLDSTASHRSPADSDCSTGRDLHGEPDSAGCGGLRGLKRMDSNISERGGLRGLTRMDSNISECGGLRGLTRMDSNMSDGVLVSPHRGAGAELRARLQRLLSKAEGRV
jgi:hypothetical protein